GAEVTALRPYMPEVLVDKSYAYGDYYVIAMKGVSQQEGKKDLVRDAADRAVQQAVPDFFEALSPTTRHRLYVAALFHTKLTDLTRHELMQVQNTERYNTRQELEDLLGNHLGIEKAEAILDPLFQVAVAYIVEHRKNDEKEKSYISHNDMRDPNWIGKEGHILIDFANATLASLGGGRYRDIARILFGDPLRITPSTIKSAVECYWIYVAAVTDERVHPDIEREYQLTLLETFVDAPRQMRSVVRNQPRSDWDTEYRRYHSIVEALRPAVEEMVT
ncbi:MAG: hypothetical protein AABX98_03925, partial [Nanoarchaeota archaeon]